MPLTHVCKKKKKVLLLYLYNVKIIMQLGEKYLEAIRAKESEKDCMHFAKNNFFTSGYKKKNRIRKW